VYGINKIHFKNMYVVESALVQFPLVLLFFSTFFGNDQTEFVASAKRRQTEQEPVNKTLLREIMCRVSTVE
jgi:hypothetical protein